MSMISYQIDELRELANKHADDAFKIYGAIDTIEALSAKVREQNLNQEVNESRGVRAVLLTEDIEAYLWEEQIQTLNRLLKIIESGRISDDKCQSKLLVYPNNSVRSDIISRQAAINAVWNHVTRDASTEEIESLPSMDRPKGKWIYNEKIGTFKIFTCSECGINMETEWNYCPGCGAEMRGATDGNAENEPR